MEGDGGRPTRGGGARDRVNSPVLAVAPSAAMDLPSLRRHKLAIGASGLGDKGREYRLIACIAKGGMGEIYLASMRDGDGRPRKVIVKRLLEELRTDDDHVAMFKAEAEVMHRLDHPNIVKIIDEPVIDGTPCLAMEYVQGRSVGHMISRCVSLKRTLPVQAILYIMAKTLRGLSHVHESRLDDGELLKLVHRDITPGNLLVSFDGDVKITDFGISKSQMSRVSTTVGIVKGKARYLAPEQILGKPASPRSDLFSCACVTIEMITLKPLFERATVPKTLYSIVHGERPKVTDLISIREPDLTDALEQALSTKPSRRQADARELAEQLERVADGMSPPMTRSKLGALTKDLFDGAREPWESAPVELLERDTDGPAGGGTLEGRSLTSDSADEDDPVLQEEYIEETSAPVPAARFTSDHGDDQPTLADDTLRPTRAPTVRVVETDLEAPLPTLSDDTPGLSDEHATLAVSTEGAMGSSGPKHLVAVEVDSKEAVERLSEDTDLLARRRKRGARNERTRIEDPPGETSKERSAVDFHDTSARQRDPARRPDSWEVDTDNRLRRQPVDPAQRPPATPKIPSTRPLVGNGPAVFLAFAIGAVGGVAATLALQAPPDPIPEAPPAPVPIAPTQNEATQAPPTSDDTATPTPPKAPSNDAPMPTAEAKPRPAPEDEQMAPLPEGETPQPRLVPPPKDEPPPAAESSTLDVVSPAGARVRIDGTPLKKRVPVRGLTLEPGRHRVQVSKGKYRRTVDVTLAPGDHEVVRFRRKKRRKRRR